MKIPEGYKLMVVNEEGSVCDEIEIGGWEPSKPIGRNVLASEIMDVLERVAKEANGE